MPVRRSRSPRLFAALTVALLISGCGVFAEEREPGPVAEEFLGHIAAGQLQQAAQLTDTPRTAADRLRQVQQELDPEKVTIALDQVRRSGDTATASYTETWQLGSGRTWKFSSSAELADDGQRWQVRWSPSVIHPKLGAQQTLALTTEPVERAPVLDRSGRELLSPQKIIVVQVEPDEVSGLPRVAKTLAGAVDQFAPSITPESITTGVQQTEKGKNYTVVLLTEPDYQKVKPTIYELPGVRFLTRNRLQPPEEGFASQLVPGVRRYVSEREAGAAGWRVATVDSAGSEVDVLHRTEPTQPPATTLSVDNDVQASAEKAVDTREEPTIIVAMKPSTGGILAVAQNAAADAKGPLALSGRYPPGSTFKIINATWGLENGAFTPKTSVPCPGTLDIGNRVIPNEGQFDLGTVEVHTAFARSCNTSFAKLAAGYPADGLTEAAKQLGLGMDYTTPGITTVTGQVPPAEGKTQRLENGIGQGKVLASPFGMALVAASVKKGSVPKPSLIQGTTTKLTNGPVPEPPKPETFSQVRQMMREVVTSGTATELKGLGEVHGKTGTAQYGDGTHSHGWFAGYRGDVAFATLVVGGETSHVAVDVTKPFLQGIG